MSVHDAFCPARYIHRMLDDGMGKETLYLETLRWTAGHIKVLSEEKPDDIDLAECNDAVQHAQDLLRAHTGEG